MPLIFTERLQLITFTADMMKALLTGPEQLEALIPYRVPEDYPMEVYKQLFPYKIERFNQYPDENEWEGLIIHKESNTVIGDMGFKGGPNGKGKIDLGYSILPAYQGNGYATEMARAMVEWGSRQPGVQTVIATCSPGNGASIRVLEKAGFRKTRTDEDTIYWQA